MEFEFEFDPSKSQANKSRHGIDFVEAQEFWSDGNMLFLSSNYEAEERRLGTALYRDRYWTAIFALRDGAIRLISVTRSRKNEIEAHQTNIG